jgi:hypothetical protein
MKVLFENPSSACCPGPPHISRRYAAAEEGRSTLCLTKCKIWDTSGFASHGWDTTPSEYSPALCTVEQFAEKKVR